MFKRLLVVFSLLLILSTNLMPVYAAADESIISQEDIKQIEREQRAELRAIWDDYDVEVTESDKTTGLRWEDPGFIGIGSKGDILMALDSITDHVAIVKDSYIVVEAHPDNPNGGVDYRDNNWKTRYSKIKGLRVSDATRTDNVNAVSYAELQLDKPYTMATTHWTTDKWYCSKLVWRAWYEQGFDIEGRTYEPRGTHVTPGDILDSPLTKVFYSSY